MRWNRALLAAAAACLLTGVAFAQQPGQGRYEGHMLAQVVITDLERAELALSICPDVWEERITVGENLFRGAPDQLAALEDAGFTIRVVHQNVQALIDAEAQAIEAARNQRGATFFDSYRPYDEVNAYIDTLIALRPDLA
ncbi:MAG: hypothetical protein VYC34_07335, partial [Planctomycetota bacterium]|nr:hypothetical protein [Planctomycetota bacterium]